MIVKVYIGLVNFSFPFSCKILEAVFMYIWKNAKEFDKQNASQTCYTKDPSILAQKTVRKLKMLTFLCPLVVKHSTACVLVNLLSISFNIIVWFCLVMFGSSAPCQVSLKL